MALKLIVGLGNPGRQYAGTRHNLGFMCVDTLAERHGFKFTRRQSRALIGDGKIAGHKVVLAKPQTFMNLSGESVRGLIGWYKLQCSDLLVIHDDLDLQLGKMRIRERGSAGGHHGLESIINSLKTDQFPRLRVGIDRPPGGETIDYVLSSFRSDEWPVIQETRHRVAEAVEGILSDGIAAAMNKYNR